VVQHNTINVKSTGLFDKFFSKNSQTFDHVKISDVEFLESTNKLTEKANIVANGLGGLGIHCQQLTTEEIVELFYAIYNPDESTKQRITDVEQIDAQVVGSESESPDAANVALSASIVRIDNSEVVKAQQKFQAEQKTAVESSPLGAGAGQTAESPEAPSEDGTVPPAGKTPNGNAPLPTSIQTESFADGVKTDTVSKGVTNGAQKTASNFPTINTQN